MIEPLLDLPAHLRERLARALETGLVGPPYGLLSLRSALGASDDVPDVCEALQALAARGLDGPAVALGLSMAEQAAARIDRADLVWSGPEVPGLHARDTRRVYDELIAAARRSIWLSTYTYYEGQKAFRSLAQRLDTTPSLQANLLLNIGRNYGDKTASDALIAMFAERFRTKDWPGQRQPEVFYDPRSLEIDGAGGVLHAKAIIVDEEAAFVTSANMTERAFDWNIEAGVLSRDRTLAASLARHFRVLIERELLLPLP